MFLRMKDGILRPAGNDLEETQANQRMNAAEVERFFADTLADRRKKPQEDLLSMFASAEVGGDKLTDDEILGICFLFLLAGLDTVTDTLECFFAYLAQHPDATAADRGRPFDHPHRGGGVAAVGNAGDRRAACGATRCGSGRVPHAPG